MITKTIKITVFLLLFLPSTLYAGIEELEKLAEMQKESVADTLRLCSEIKEAGDWYEKHTGDPKITELPIWKPVKNCLVTSEKGLRKISVGTKNHRGVDLVDKKYRGRSGAPIYATGDGVVVFIGRKGGYGNFVEIMHRDGRLVSRYGHLKRSFVYLGEHVKHGQIIGEIGNTGTTTGPHLDYSIKAEKNGRWRFEDPADWIIGYDEFEFKYPRKNRI